MPAALELRDAHIDDAETMVRLHFASVRAIAGNDYPQDVLAAWSPPPDEGRFSWMRGVITSTDVSAFVVHRSNELAGFALCAAREGFVRAVYVGPEWTGRGVGQMLLDACERAARDQGVARVRVLASLNAVGFYRRAGYEVVGPTTQELGDGSEMACIEMQRAVHALNPRRG